MRPQLLLYCPRSGSYPCSSVSKHLSAGRIGLRRPRQMYCAFSCEISGIY